MVDCINSGSIIISGNWKIQIMGLDETRVPPKYLQPSVVQWTSRERCVCRKQGVLIGRYAMDEATQSEKE